ncbi:MAG: hypothetical protein R6V18_06880 [Desulfuromonadaceae bacterium]
MLMQEEVDAREEQLRSMVRELPQTKRAEFFRAAEKELKDPDTYAVLNYIFIAGLHHFYLGRWGRGLVNLLIFSVGIFALFMGLIPFGIILLVGISAIELYALFRAQTIVQAHNNDIMQHIYSRLTSAGNPEEKQKKTHLQEERYE